MTHKTNSFAYTRQVLRSLTRQAFEEVERLGGNAGVEAILRKLEVEEPTEEAEKGLEAALGRLRTESGESLGLGGSSKLVNGKGGVKVNGHSKVNGSSSV